MPLRSIALQVYPPAQDFVATFACICFIVKVFIVSMTKIWKPKLDEGNEPIYLAIARAIAVDVASGRLRPGDRLPPQRDLALDLGIALGTVSRAYAETERRGLITGRGRRGTTVTAGAGETPRGLKGLAARHDLIDLFANYPTSSLDPDLPSALRAIARHPASGYLLRYPPPEGWPEHREVIAQWLIGLGVSTISADSVVMTAGAQHAIGAAISAFTAPGDEAACEALTYPGFMSAAQSHGIKFHPIEIDGNGLVPEAFAEACRRSPIRLLYMMPSLHNPTAVGQTLDRRTAIAEVAEKFDVMIVEDEIERSFCAFRLPPYINIAPDRSALIWSASKSIAGGLRVGCIVSSAGRLDALVQSVQSNLVAAPSLNAEVLRVWIESGQAARSAEARRKEVKARYKLARRVFGDAIPAERATPYSLLELPEPWTSSEFVREARARGVAVASAELFAVDSSRAPNAVRLALCAPTNRQSLERGLEIVRGTLEGSSYRRSATL